MHIFTDLSECVNKVNSDFFFIIRCESDKSKHVNGKRPKMTLRSDGLRNVCLIMPSFVEDKLIFPSSEIEFL